MSPQLVLMNKRYRLTQSLDFQRVQGEGRSWAHPLAILRASPNHLDSSRFGFSVGKWVGKAVVRNRARRLLREAVRHRIERIQRGWDIVFVARSPIAQADYGQVDRAVEALLQRARLSIEMEEHRTIAPGG